MKKVIIILAVLAVVAAGAGLYLYQANKSAEKAAAELTASPSRDLRAEEIRSKLKSGSFREKLAAKKQIDKLPPADRVAVLKSLLKDKEDKTRLLAVSALGKMADSADAKALLAEVAKSDTAENVKRLAAGFLAPPAPVAPAIVAPAAPAVAPAAAPAVAPAAPAAAVTP